MSKFANFDKYPKVMGNVLFKWAVDAGIDGNSTIAKGALDVAGVLNRISRLIPCGSAVLNAGPGNGLLRQLLRSACMSNADECLSLLSEGSK